MRALTRWARMAAVPVVAALFAITAGCQALPQRADRVNADTIRSIEIGMSEQEVIAILGPPLRVRPWGPDWVCLDYALPGWSRQSPSLWVSLDHGVVRTVHAKIYPILAEDRAIYEAAVDRSMFDTADFETAFGRP